MIVDFFRGHVRYRPLDQVNVVFRGALNRDQLLDEVLRAFNSAGWGRGAQVDEYLLEFDDYFRRQINWRTNGRFHKRYHIRLWTGLDEVLGSAHKERLRKWPFPRHDVESFEEAKQVIEDLFDRAGWRIRHDSRQVGPAIEHPSASGWASEITYP